MCLGASWGRLGAVLGRLEASKNASWERLGDVLGRLGASKNDIENEADVKSENGRSARFPKTQESSGKLRKAPEKLFLGAKMRPKALQDAFETALVLHPIFNAFFLRSWLDFPSQLGSQNPPKLRKTQCQEAIHLELHFLIDF